MFAFTTLLNSASTYPTKPKISISVVEASLRQVLLPILIDWWC